MPSQMWLRTLHSRLVLKCKFQFFTISLNELSYPFLILTTNKNHVCFLNLIYHDQNTILLHTATKWKWFKLKFFQGSLGVGAMKYVFLLSVSLLRLKMNNYIYWFPLRKKRIPFFTCQILFRFPKHLNLQTNDTDIKCKLSIICYQSVTRYENKWL